MMSEELIRLFRITDGEMLLKAAVFLNLFITDEAEFFAFSEVIFAPSFKTDFQADIDAAHHELEDYEVVGDLKIETQEFLQKLKECEVHYRELKFFVQKAYPGSKTMVARFGFPKYRNAKKSQGGMILFIEALAYAAEKYKVKLIAQGYTQARIDELQTLVAEVKQQGIEQEEAKADRLQKTRERIVAMNMVWDRMVTINRASKTIYRDNYTKLKQYGLPSSKSKSTSTEAQS